MAETIKYISSYGVEISSDVYHNEIRAEARYKTSHKDYVQIGVGVLFIIVFIAVFIAVKGK